MIQQVNPLASYLARKKEIDTAVVAVLEGGWYILGSEVSLFEKEFATYIGVNHAIGVGNGTDALYLALKACGIGQGDAVVTVSLTAVATIAAIEMTGALPVLVDINPNSYTIDYEKLERTIQNHKDIHFKAIIPVHLYGRPAEIIALRDIACKYGLYLVEDCAQSHGATVKGIPTGAWGDIAAFSFYPTKNLGAFGDGGIVVTNNPGLAEKVKLLREYGWQERYISKIPGINSRLDELQAAILRVKLHYLNSENKQRRHIASTYNEKLRGIPYIIPPEPGKEYHVYHQYVIRTSKRDELRTYLKNSNIITLIHYPHPVHAQPAYTNRVGIGAGGLIHTEQACQEILSLPMYPQLTDEQVLQVCKTIQEWEP